MTEKSGIIAMTERLTLRRLHEDDLSDLARILGDPETMYVYEGAFSDAENRDWLDRMLRRYRDDGISLYAVILNATGEFIGQCGLTMQDIHGARVVEVGYLFRREFWHCGYATEAACACRNYAFSTLGVSEVYSIIRDTNLASQGVARRMGMTHTGEFTKNYRGIDMPHFIYRISSPGVNKI